MRPRNLLPHLVAVFLLSAGVYWLTSGVSAKPPVLQSLPVPSAALPAPPAAGELSPEARARQDREWGGFRLAFPFHIQVIAASDPYPDGTRTLIVSEPPPDATVDGLKALDAVALATAEVKTHTVGHDGWVKDVVFNVTAKQEELDRLVARLSKYLFETDYKAYCLKLPVNRESLRTKYPLDLRVGAAELKHWIDGRFTPVDGGAAAKGLAEMTAGQGGVFVSTTPGLVAWVIPPGVGLETRRADARRFAVDSDVIVGAVQTSNQAVVVLGRERIAPVDVMPPLRTETILLLASADTDQLAQSYERNAFFAGKFKGPWDWAPAYLSPQLIDTEYGSLLNIADQLLKSWTQHGELRYQNFPYPDPSPFPFEGPLARVLHAHSLLFNWNTTGAGFVVDLGDTKVYGLNRTGALPIIYRPDDADGEDQAIHGDVARVKRAEEDAYTFFATQNDPCLARVVQYTALYQCFRAFGVKAPPPAPAKAGDSTPVFRAQIRAAMKALLEASDDEVKERVYDRVARQVQLLRNPALGKPISGVDAGSRQLSEYARQLDDAMRLRAVLQAFHKKWKNDGLDKAAAFAAAALSRDSQSRLINLLLGDKQQAAMDELFKAIYENRDSLSCWVDPSDVKRQFSAAQGKGGDRWMHTQTVVVSCNIGDLLGWDGGHNVDAEVTRFEASRDVLPGEVRQAPDGTIQYNPADIGRISELVRLAAREKTNPDLPSLLKKRWAATPQQSVEGRDTALAIGGRGPGDFRIPPGERPAGGEAPPPPPPGGPPDGVPAPGIDPPDKPPPPPPSNGVGGEPKDAGGFFDAAPGGVLLEKQDGTIKIYRGAGAETQAAEAWNAHDAVYAVCAELQRSGRGGDGEPLEALFGKGYSEADVQAFLKTLPVEAERYREAAPVLVFRNLTPKAQARLASRVSQATPKAFDVGLKNQEVRITGALDVTDHAKTTFGMSVDIRLAGGVAVDPKQVNTTVRNTAQRVTEHGHVRVDSLGVEIYKDLRRELYPDQWPPAVITVDDAGDFIISLEEEPGDVPSAVTR